jgi:uncharacterized membrane protein YphA (DoxX/SURF4 family)
MAQAFLVGRILAGCYYLVSAFNLFTNVGLMSRSAAAHGVPAPEAAVIVAGLLLLVGGASFLFGAFPEIGVSALVLFFVPVVVLRYAFWPDHDPIQQQRDLLNIGKDIALLGSALMSLAVPQPWPYSVERRLHLPVRAPV